MSERPVRVKVRDIELAMRASDIGSQLAEGPLFLWGHGLLGSVAQEDSVPIFDWSSVCAHARLVRYDARSHGDSDLDLDPAHLRWPELARDMLGLADALGAPRALLGGVSMGCATSLHAAVLAPDRVIGLVLVAPPTAWETRPRQARFYRVGSTLVDWFGLAPFRLLASLPRPGSTSAVAALQSGVMQHLARADARAVVTAMRGAADSDLPDRGALRELRIPTLILAWRGDPVHPVSTATQLAELLPRAELHVATTLDEVRAWPVRIAAFVQNVCVEAHL
jgi:pimeloyl-ACP methyl ester carboxylesterase